MNPLNLKSNIRKLARGDYYQTLFAFFKDGFKVEFFSNQKDFTDLQMMFLKYLNFYSALNTDVALGDVPEKVLEDDIYSDAYMMYKNNADKKRIKSAKNSVNNEEKFVPSSKWLFKDPVTLQNKIKTQVKNLERAVKQ